MCSSLVKILPEFPEWMVVRQVIQLWIGSRGRWRHLNAHLDMNIGMMMTTKMMMMTTMVVMMIMKKKTVIGGVQRQESTVQPSPPASSFEGDDKVC